MVQEIYDSYKVAYHPVEDDADKVYEVDWTPPFRRVSMIPELEKQLNVAFPPATEFETPGYRGGFPTFEFSGGPYN